MPECALQLHVRRAPAEPVYVVIPVGGAGASVRWMARMGRQPSGGQRPRSNTQAIRAIGRAALGAMRPDHPSRQSSSPTAWKRGHVRR